MSQARCDCCRIINIIFGMYVSSSAWDRMCFGCWMDVVCWNGRGGSAVSRIRSECVIGTWITSHHHHTITRVSNQSFIGCIHFCPCRRWSRIELVYRTNPPAFLPFCCCSVIYPSEEMSVLTCIVYSAYLSRICLVCNTWGHSSWECTQSRPLDRNVSTQLASLLQPILFRVYD